MNRKEFKTVIKLIKSSYKKLNKLYGVGVDLYEGKYNISYEIDGIVDIMFSNIYDKNKVDLVMWWIWETDFGKNDNNKVEIDGKEFIVDTIDKFYSLFLEE